MCISLNLLYTSNPPLPLSDTHIRKLIQPRYRHIHTRATWNWEGENEIPPIPLDPYSPISSIVQLPTITFLSTPSFPISTQLSRCRHSARTQSIITVIPITYIPTHIYTYKHILSNRLTARITYFDLDEIEKSKSSLQEWRFERGIVILDLGRGY